jgi:hypothetical protein
MPMTRKLFHDNQEETHHESDEGRPEQTGRRPDRIRRKDTKVPVEGWSGPEDHHGPEGKTVMGSVGGHLNPRKSTMYVMKADLSNPGRRSA